MASGNNSQQNLRLGMLPVDQTAVFLCDLQEKFQPAMLHFKEIVENAKKLVDVTRILSIPLIVTEQYPKGLGSTVSAIDITHATGVFPKTKFSMVIPEVEKKMVELCSGHLKCVVLFGVEAHVCVEQTAIDLRNKGIEVHVVADASTSRSQEDRLLAFERLKQAGCFVTTSENVIYKLIGDKDHPKFNEIRPLIKERSAESGLVAKMCSAGLLISNGFMLLSRQCKLELACLIVSSVNDGTKGMSKFLEQLQVLIKGKMIPKMVSMKSTNDLNEISGTNSSNAAGSLQKTCSVCSRTFKRLQELKRHMKVHSGSSHFLCQSCGRSFRSKEGLEYHCSLNHSDSVEQTTVECKECKKPFTSMQQLKIHVKNTHQRAKADHECPVCHKTFQRSDVFQNHVDMHSADLKDLFTCNLCDKTFSSKSNLHSHQRIHDPKLELRCSCCSRKFNSNKKLSSHESECLKKKSCGSCKFSCQREEDFMEHMRKCHPGDYAVQTIFGNTLEMNF